MSARRRKWEWSTASMWGRVVMICGPLLVAGLVAGGFYLGLQPHREHDDPTSRTEFASLTWVLMDGGTTVRFEIDQRDNWTRITDGRFPALETFVHDGRLIVSMPTGSGRTGYLSVPADSVLPEGVSAEALVLAGRLDRRPRECSLPSDEERAAVYYFLGDATSGFSGQFHICGSSTARDIGDSPLRAEEQYMVAPPAWPDADAIVQVESLGDEGKGLLADFLATWPYKSA